MRGASSVAISFWVKLSLAWSWQAAVQAYRRQAETDSESPQPTTSCRALTIARIVLWAPTNTWQVHPENYSITQSERQHKRMCRSQPVATVAASNSPPQNYYPRCTTREGELLVVGVGFVEIFITTPPAALVDANALHGEVYNCQEKAEENDAAHAYD